MTAGTGRNKSALSLPIGFAVPEGGSDIDRRGMRLLKKIELIEIRPVVFPTDPRARIQRVKSLLDAGETLSADDFNRQLCDELGLSRRYASAFLSGGCSAFAERRTPGA